MFLHHVFLIALSTHFHIFMKKMILIAQNLQKKIFVEREMKKSRTAYQEKSDAIRNEFKIKLRSINLAAII